MYNQNTTPIRTNIFPCKSINLVRFLKQNGLLSEHKYTDASDNKDCWIFLRTEKLNSLLAQWKVIQDKRFNSNLNSNT
ncbi:MAG: hypothetical protein A2Y34_05465 [Spirochaetes bacterium GWC1_27_15]|nr:MAG: hypothetical protein A2Y34_05465 [Spirochaetes bacterium GWC1_27_15]